jgi:predicted ribosomally synthesized peptide with SipW-like signal peptide
MIIKTDRGEVKRLKKKILTSIFVILVCVAMISAATMAWFTDLDTAGEATFTAGTVSIEAGRKIAVNGEAEGTENIVEGEFYPARVTDSHQGPAGINQNKQVRTERSNEEAVLTLEIGQNESNFYSLGFGGWIIMEFDHSVYSPELVIVVEDTWGGSYPLETADIFVSKNGEDNSWVYAGKANNRNLQQNQTNTEFRISIDNILPYVKYVKVVDTTNVNDFVQYSGNTVDGFDLNTVRIKGVTAEEDIWNPGDCDERVYTIVNKGSKSIKLRGLITGRWHEFDEDSNGWIPWTPNPDKGVVTISAVDNSSGWVKNGDYFYFEPDIPGTYGGTLKEARTVDLKVKVCLDGENSDNQYQGKRYIVTAAFEAIQASNGAAESNGWYIQPN